MTSFLLLLSLCISAQQTASFQELLAKMQHLKERYTGQGTDNDRAVTVIMRKLSDDYQGRLSLTQYRQLNANLQQMQAQTSDPFQQQQLSEALQLLHSKSDTLEWANDTLASNRAAAHVTTEQIDAEIAAYSTALKSIDAMRERYIADCAAMTSQFGIINTHDLSKRAKVDDYDIRKVA
jgi:hypothetical protein